MIYGELSCKEIHEGFASRYIKPRWYINGKLSTEAFDLRQGKPPETYVSHFKTDSNDIESFNLAYTLISKRIKKCDNGSIAMLNIVEALNEVNDEDEPFIKFVEKDLPHCGLIYTTNNQEEIQEAKATLCFLAEKYLIQVKHILERTKGENKIR